MTAATQQVLAPGKAMLIGEYAVLDGAPGVVAAVTAYARAHLSAAARPASPFIDAALAEARAALSRDLPGVPVVDTSPFSRDGRKLGLGSSAAATVAALGACYAACGRDPAAYKSEIAAAADRAHARAQGARGSGADVLAAALGGVQVLNCPAPASALPAQVRFVATSRSSATPDLIRRYRDRAPQSAAAELAGAARDFLRAWTDGDAAALLLAVGRAFAGYGALSRALDVPLITPEHAAIEAAARAVGGAAKPSGAGGGDLAVAFLPDEDAAVALARALPEGTHLLPLTISAAGVHAAADLETQG